MQRVSLKAYAKVNIGLRIDGRRNDGYHTLKTLFQTISIHDNLILELQDEQGIGFYTTGLKVPTGEDNICVKAAQKVLERENRKSGINIRLEKYISVGSGLGGGSSDAAAVIRGLNKLLKLDLDNSEMEAVALELGADIPFFIRGGCQYAEGIGELLSPGEIEDNFIVLLVIPDISITTSWAYKNLDYLSLTSDTEDVNLARFPRNGETNKRRYFRNDFENLVFSEYPEIGEIKRQISESGAVYASLSGSGSGVFGLYDSKDEAENGKEKLGKDYDSYILKLIPGFKD
ncbi:4-(cytidine 5'-diphospho)-2-C-methyl-D-erythritol kinase [Candidatus Marinimicrobia bacterium MT.SAG.3]|nr:4-(cytidine 5'-diphospho)-2-C-methyl-D-erythritol kinase [Candidatus Marinimicrobia bacterium MT.SAG.3]